MALWRWWSYKTTAVWSGFCSGGGGETRSTSHKTPSNHLTRLEVNYGVQQINMHKSFREKREVLCTLAFMSDQVEARECLMWSEQQQSIKQERGWQDGLDIHMRRGHKGHFIRNEPTETLVEGSGVVRQQHCMFVMVIHKQKGLEVSEAQEAETRPAG